MDGDAGGVAFVEPDRFPAPTPTGTAGSLRAPIPGTVVALSIGVGDEVVVDQELLVLEAMKMRYVIRADHAGRVVELPVSLGSSVELGAVLAVLAPQPLTMAVVDALDQEVL